MKKLVIYISLSLVTFTLLSLVAKRSPDSVSSSEAVRTKPTGGLVPFSSLALASGPQKLAINFQMRFECSLGDQDAVEMDLYFSNNKRMLLSFESLLSDASIPAQTRSISESDFTKGFRQEFALPSKSAQMGLFICKDSSQAKKCMGKPSLHASEVIVKNTELSKDPGYQAPDRVYSFHYFLFTGTKLFLPPADAFLPQTATLLESKLKELAAAEQASFLDIPKAIAIAAPYNASLSPQPFRVSSSNPANQLDLVLVKHQGPKCKE